MCAKCKISEREAITSIRFSARRHCASWLFFVTRIVLRCRTLAGKTDLHTDPDDLSCESIPGLARYCLPPNARSHRNSMTHDQRTSEVPNRNSYRGSATDARDRTSIIAAASVNCQPGIVRNNFLSEVPQSVRCDGRAEVTRQSGFCGLSINVVSWNGNRHFSLRHTEKVNATGRRTVKIIQSPRIIWGNVPNALKPALPTISNMAKLSAGTSLPV